MQGLAVEEVGGLEGRACACVCACVCVCVCAKAWGTSFEPESNQRPKDVHSCLFSLQSSALPAELSKGAHGRGRVLCLCADGGRELAGPVPGWGPITTVRLPSQGALPRPALPCPTQTGSVLAFRAQDQHTRTNTRTNTHTPTHTLQCAHTPSAWEPLVSSGSLACPGPGGDLAGRRPPRPASQGAQGSLLSCSCPLAPMPNLCVPPWAGV